MLYTSLLPEPGSRKETIRASDLARLLGISGKTLYVWVEAGRLPKPIELSPRLRVFSVAEVRAALVALQGQDTEVATKPRRKK